ncbi:formate/nitrite transporter family protein [Actinobaculum massiliense]|uniref:formate/nitrite transporter family protein n=1 Tax=Actinobaculum massiliense TaxID=202789 RepID=UPI00288AB020|nr:formate/nitrite transporter family protein [Actinobaculum massiliense]
MADLQPVIPAAADLAVENANAAYKKTQKRPAKALWLALAGGFFIGIGYIFYITSQQGLADAPVGPAKVLGGIVFTVGLFLVIVTGADLFTSTTMTVMPLYSRRITVGRWARHWATSITGNLVGALTLAFLVFASGQYMANGGEWGLVALQTAAHKTDHTFIQALLLGVLANIAVCLGVYMAQSGRSTTDKFFGCLGLIALFVSTGFEHSIANMFLLPLGYLVKVGGGDAFWSSTAVADAAVQYADFESFNLQSIVLGNWVPVLIGNAIGGAIFVASYFYIAYVRDAECAAAAAH